MATTSAAPSTRLMWAILGLVLLADALDMIDATVTNIAAPTIVGDIGGGDGLIKWLGASYALAMGVLLVIGGRLGDRYGQRRLFLVGIVGFTLSSALCGFAPEPGILIAARVAQGAFGALLIPQGMAIMTKTFSPQMLTKAFGLFAPMLGVATVGGPVLAGFIIDADIAGLSWRPIFIINIVLGAIGIVGALKLLPRDNGGDRSVVIDGIGSGLLSAAMLGLLFGLIEGSSDGWSVLPVVALVVGLVAFALFVRRQQTAANPPLKPSLLRNRGFSSGLATGLVVFAATSGLAYVLSLFLQQALGADPGDTSLGLLPLTGGIIVAAGSCMALMPRLGRMLIFIGLAILAAGVGALLWLVSAYGTELTLWQLAPAIFLTGLGMGACYGTIFDIALGNIDADEAGSASGSLSAIQQLAAGIGSATVTTVFLQTSSGGFVHAMTVSLVVVLGAVVVCMAPARLLPRRAAAEPAHH